MQTIVEYLKSSHVGNTRQNYRLNDIDRVINWIKRNKLDNNFKKCQRICFHLCDLTIDTDYFAGENLIPRASTVRDLGVVLDEKWSFCEHINSLSLSLSNLLRPWASSRDSPSISRYLMQSLTYLSA